MPAALCSKTSKTVKKEVEMAHEITETDGAVYHSKPAWHGLGVVVDEAPTTKEALRLAGLEWGILQKPMFTTFETIAEDGSVVEERVEVPSHVANYRADNRSLLGVVSANYQPISNIELADFCDKLLGEATGKVRIESAGSIRGGKRVWFLLKGHDFTIGKGDVIYPYILASNGHDGGATCRITPTTIRVVCSNTLHQVIPRTDNGELMGSAISLKHTSNLMERIEEAREALRVYGTQTEKFKNFANDLTKRQVSSEQIRNFFLESYGADFGEIPLNPQTKSEKNAQNRAMSAIASFSRRFDDESSIAGTSVWNMVNAYSGLIQQDKKGRGKNDVAIVESRTESNLLGLNQDRTMKALERAYRMCIIS